MKRYQKISFFVKFAVLAVCLPAFPAFSPGSCLAAETTGSETDITTDPASETATAERDATASENGPDADKTTIDASEDTSTDASFLSVADGFADDLLAGDFDRIRTEYSYDATLAPVVVSGQLEQSFQLYLSGELQERKEAFVSAVQTPYTNVDVPCLFDNQSWNLTVTFTESGTIAGIHISPYQEGTPETDNTSTGSELPDTVMETELTLELENGWELPGTLTVPRDAETYAAVVFVHGSGSSDRNETVGNIQPFRDLAWELAELGIASYRYDKISYVYGNELVGDTEFTVYDETVNDAAAAIRLLREQPEITSVYVAGHSQGGMMMGAIAGQGKPDGCILLAAPARGFAETMKRQIAFLQELGGDSLSEEEQQQYAWYEEQLALFDHIDELEDTDTVLGQSLTYIRSLTEYDILGEAEKITVPVLVLQGEEDYQVTMDDFQLWKDRFETNENWSFHSYPGLTHLFTEGSYENGPADYEGEKHVPTEVTQDMASFVISVQNSSKL